VPNHECSIPGANSSHSLNESSHGFNHTSSLSVSSRLPPPLPANETGIYTASYTSKPVIGTHQLFTKSSGLLFSNAISGFVKPTGTGPSIHPYGTYWSFFEGIEDVYSYKTLEQTKASHFLDWTSPIYKSPLVHCC
jgi:hypothetical protein